MKKIYYRKYQGGWITAAIAGGAALLGGVMGNDANAKEASRNRAFQENAAKNRHQWEVDDLRAAGLNPILSGTGGSGSATNATSAATQQDAITPAVQSAMAARQQDEQLQLMKAQTEKTKQEEKTTHEAEQTQRNQQANLAWDTALKERQIQQTEAATRNTDMATLRTAEEVRTESERAAFVRAQAEEARQRAAYTSHTARSAKVEADIDSHERGIQMKWLNRATDSAEGVSSAARGFINPFHGSKQRPPYRR